MDGPAMAAPVPHFDNTLGALYLGSIFAAVFFGITSIQTYLYFDDCRDGKFLKSLVGLLWFLDAIHFAFAVHAVYHYNVTNFMNPANIGNTIWSILAINIISSISDTMVRSVYAYRIWMLSKRATWIVVMIAIPSLLMIGVVLVATIREGSTGTYAGLNSIKWDVCLIFGSSAVADIIIAATLCTLFWQHRSRIRRTQNIIRTMMLWSVNTSVLTSSCALAVLITFSAMSTNFIFMGIYLVMPKLYLNSLLATLNAREKIREAGSSNGDLVSIPLSRLEEASRAGSQAPSLGKMNLDRASPRTDMQIQVDTIVTTEKSSF